MTGTAITPELLASGDVPVAWIADDFAPCARAGRRRNCASGLPWRRLPWDTGAPLAPDTRMAAVLFWRAVQAHADAWPPGWHLCMHSGALLCPECVWGKWRDLFPPRPSFPPSPFLPLAPLYGIPAADALEQARRAGAYIPPGPA